MKIETLDEQCSISNWKQLQNTGVPEFEIDLRVPGVPEEMVQQDKNKMKEIGVHASKILRIGSNAASIREDLSKRRR